MNTFITCTVCGDQDDRKAKTGACIDGKYHCQVCYEEAMESMENSILAEVFA